MRTSKRWMALSAVALVACGMLNAAAADKKPAPRICVPSMSELTALGLEDHVKKKRGKLVLGKKSQCLVTPDGSSLAAVLLELPSYEEPYSIVVDSRLTESVLVPRVDMLDAQKAPTRSLGLADVKRRGGSLTIDVFVNPENAGERYLALYPDPNAFGQSETRSTMGIQSTYIVSGTWMSGSEAKTLINYVDEGTVVVSLKGARWE